MRSKIVEALKRCSVRTRQSVWSCPVVVTICHELHSTGFTEIPASHLSSRLSLFTVAPSLSDGLMRELILSCSARMFVAGNGGSNAPNPERTQGVITTLMFPRHDVSPLPDVDETLLFPPFQMLASPCGLQKPPS